DVAHRHVEQAVPLPGAEDGDDAGMLDRGRRPRLGAKARPEVLVMCELRPDHLERDRPVELELAGEVDDPHAAVAERSLDPVTAEQRARREARRPDLPGRSFDRHRLSMEGGQAGRVGLWTGPGGAPGRTATRALRRR